MAVYRFMVSVSLSDGLTRWVSDDLTLTTQDGDASVFTAEEADTVADDFKVERTEIVQLEGAE